MNTPPRLNRLFAADGRCCAVALDHGFVNERAFLTGIEDMRHTVATMVAADPDALQLSAGMAPILQTIVGKTKPALVLRTDVTNIYAVEIPRYQFNRRIEEAVEQALVLDAACVVASLLLLVDLPGLHSQCIGNISDLKPICNRYGMPLMIQPLVMQRTKNGGYRSEYDLDKLLPLVRQAAELGADVIMADPCEDISQYHQVTEVASGCPVLVRGGHKISEESLIQRTYEVMRQGATGIVYGRNIIQHKSPTRMIRALMALVHDTVTVEQALQMVRDENMPKQTIEQAT